MPVSAGVWAKKALKGGEAAGGSADADDEVWRLFIGRGHTATSKPMSTLSGTASAVARLLVAVWFRWVGWVRELAIHRE